MTGMDTGISSLSRSLAALRKLSPRREPAVRCEMCSQPLADVHPHLLEIAPQRLLCACDACALLFSVQGADAKYRRVPRRILFLPEFCLDDAEWDGLLIPINMAFFFQSTPRARAMAFYPSPAGPTESLLELESWNGIVARNRVLQTMEPDVEALLVNRMSRGGQGGGPQGDASGAPEAMHFVVPIDECYKLVGVIRAHWRGLSGGKTVWKEIDAFFADLKSRSQVPRAPREQGHTRCPT